MLIIIGLLFFMFIVSLSFAVSRPVIRGGNAMTEQTEKTFLANAISLAKTQRIISPGHGVNNKALYNTIYRAKKYVQSKYAKEEALSNSEKWLYENFYLVYRYIFNKKISFDKLPHCNGAPRIVNLCRFIVNNSLNCLSIDRIRGVFGNISNYLNFTYDEIIELPDALSYAIIEQIYILSQRILHQKICARMAKKKRINVNFLHSDSYVFYLLNNGKLEPNDSENKKKYNIDIKFQLHSHNLTLLQSTFMAETLFGALRDIDNYLPFRETMKYLSSYSVIKNLPNFNFLDEATRMNYFRVIQKIAKRTKVNEEIVAKYAKRLADYNGCDISVIIYDGKKELKKYIETDKFVKINKKTTFTREILYTQAIKKLTLALSIVIGALSKSAFAGILSYMPIFFIMENFVNFILSYIKHPTHTASYNYKTLPKECSTMVVICQFITGMNHFKESLENALTLYQGNLDSNIGFCMLIDLPKADTEKTALDNELAQFLSDKNYGTNFHICVRKRVMINGKYQAFERKRGALMDFNEMLLSLNNKKFSYIYNDNFCTPEFVITLDADNNFTSGGVKDMVNMFAHPYNSRYDLLGTHNKYNLYSYETDYSKRFLMESGGELYPNYSSFYSEIFKKEIFCGKGIYRLKEFDAKLRDVLPSGKILSHDILEGSIVSTGSGSTIFEDVPNGFLSDRERRKRWQRGDIQLLPFMYGRWVNDKKERVKVKISTFYRYIMRRNIFYNFKDISMLLLMVVGLISDFFTVYLGLALFLLPYAIDLIKIMSGVGKIRLKYILGHAIRHFLLMLEDFFMLGYYAISNTAIFITTIGRMMVGKGLLNWKTYYNSQNNRSFGMYVREFIFPFVVNTLLTLALFALSNYAIIMAVYMIISVFVYLRLYLSSLKALPKPKINIDGENYLKEIAQNVYNYFEFMQKGTLCADNLQLKPYIGESDNTSPTNLGFALLSNVCAYKLGFIDINEAKKRIYDDLSTIESLEKWNGNLYNWYSVKSLKKVNNFVSSVDSGNFLACLYVLKGYFTQLGDLVGEARVNSLIKNTKIETLFDDAKQMFYLGHDNGYSGHYDLLCSESRLLSTMYMARVGDCKHFRYLGRDYTSLMGNTMLSWSGTMFEYLMPDLFINIPYFSAVATTNKNVVKVQKNNKYKNIWGTSESGYYNFDENLRYQYFAFGIPKLSLRNERKVGVISPYSSLLALDYCPSDVISNLQKMQKMNVYGEYGFYESIDLRGKERVVQSYMTHHQGMLLVSITNSLCNGYIRDLFQNDYKIRAILNIYNELPSISNYSYKNEEKPKIIYNNIVKYSKNIANIEHNYVATALSDGDYIMYRTALGDGWSMCKEICLSPPSREYYAINGGYFYVSETNFDWYNPTYFPTKEDIFNFTYHYQNNEINYRNNKHNLEEYDTVFAGINGEIRKLKFNNYVNKVAFYMPIALNTEEGFSAHPAFNGLFCHTKIIDDMLVIHKNSLNLDRSKYIVVKVIGLENIVWETNRYNFVGRNGNLSKPKILYSTDSLIAPSLGDVLSPCIGFIGDKGHLYECQVAILYGDSEEELLDVMQTVGANPYRLALESHGKQAIGEITQEILGQIMYGGISKEQKYSILNSGNKFNYRQICGEKVVIAFTYWNNPTVFMSFVKIVQELILLKIKIKPLVIVKDMNFEQVKSGIDKSFIDNRINDFIIIPEFEMTGYIDFINVFFDENLKYSLRTLYKDVLGKKMNSLCEKNPIKHIYHLIYNSGYGGYDEESSYINNFPEPTLLPYSQVIGGQYGGMLVTNNGGGYFYFGNSRENKMVKFDNDFVMDTLGEYIFIESENGSSRINGGCSHGHSSVYSKGEFIHKVSVNDINSVLKYYMIADGKARILELEINNPASLPYKLSYICKPSLFWRYLPQNIVFERKNNFIIMKNMLNENNLYIKCLTSMDIINEIDADYEYPYFQYSGNKSYEKLYFIFCEDILLAHSLDAMNMPIFFDKQKSFYSGLNYANMVTEDKSTELLVNFLPYQIYSARLSAKIGFYQVSGATGFRDQLQDSLSFLSGNSDITRRQILECCEHQYIEGDVMHWWHYPKLGLRTRITDDRLFLPFAVYNYVLQTEDYDILDKKLPYLSSKPLSSEEHNRYENPPYSDFSESIFLHCVRAIRSSLKYGKHNLLLLGTGDWNDGMDNAGKNGKGESVFNSMFAVLVLENFSKICPDEFSELREEFHSIAEKLKQDINNIAFDTDRYMRLFTDDEYWVGANSNEEVRLDLLTQAFAVFCGISEINRSNTVLDTAKALVDYDAGLIKLLSPPSTKSQYLGYLSAYPKGIRENGGQYTHSAMWYLIALTMMDRQDEAYDLFQRINPVKKCNDLSKNAMYMGEPYVLSGDIYTNEDNYGRMGWSWYTGSASWCYILFTQYFFGLSRRGKKLIITPKLPKKLFNSQIIYRYENSLYLIEYKIGEEEYLDIDGVKCGQEGIELESGVRRKVTVYRKK